MVFSNKREENRVKPILNIYGRRLEQVREIKYLGLHVNDRLTFAGHTEIVEKKLARLQSVLYKNPKFVSPSIGAKLITAMAIPKLMFASTCFHRAPDYALDRLDVIYKRMIRTVYRKPLDTPTSEIYKNTMFLPLTLLRQVQLGSFAVKCLFGHCANYLKGTIQRNEELGIRQRPQREVSEPVEVYHVPHHHKTSSLGNFKIWCPKVLNVIPPNLIEEAGATENGTKLFGRKYKKYLQSLFDELVWSRDLEHFRIYFR